MTRDQARIVLLEAAVRQAQATVSFLHGCLTSPQYRYDYPDQTEARLEEWEKLVPYGPTCPHSGFEPECPGCQRRVASMRAMQAARATLEAPEPSVLQRIRDLLPELDASPTKQADLEALFEDVGFLLEN